jgi:hypothetical protein
VFPINMLPQKLSTFKGLWWLPATPDKAVPGTLSAHSESGLSFETTGSLSGEENPFGMLITGKPDSYKVVHGETDNNQTVTLFGIVEGPNNWSQNGITIISHDVNLAVVGAHVGSHEELMMSKIFVEYDCLPIWLRVSPFSCNREELPNFVMTYTHPKDITLYEDTELKWGVTWTVTQPGSRVVQLDIQASAVPCLIVVSSKPISFDNLNREAALFRKVLSLWVGSSVRATKTLGVLVQGDRHNSVSFFWKGPWDSRLSSVPAFHETVAPYPAIAAETAVIISFFRNEEATVAPILDLWDLLPFQEDLHHEQRFLNYCQILEAFHRRTIGGITKPEADFQIDLKAVIDAVPEQHRKWVARRLKFANEFSLFERIRDLWARYADVTSQFPVSEKRFCHRIGAIRNYLTHFKLEPGEKPPTQIEVMTFIFYLQILLEVSILRWLKIPDALVLARVQRRKMQAPYVLEYK